MSHKKYSLKHSAIADDVDRWATSRRTLLTCDFTAALPSRTLQDLSSAETWLLQLLADGLGNAVAERADQHDFVALEEDSDTQEDNGHSTPLDDCWMRGFKLRDRPIFWQASKLEDTKVGQQTTYE